MKMPMVVTFDEGFGSSSAVVNVDLSHCETIRDEVAILSAALRTEGLAMTTRNFEIVDYKPATNVITHEALVSLSFLAAGIACGHILARAIKHGLVSRKGN